MLKFITDVLIVGGGLAGYRAAAAAAETGAKVILIERGNCASHLVMGFNAAVNADDSDELFLKDLEISGSGIGDPSLKERLVKGSREEVAYFEKSGITFDKTDENQYHTISVLGSSRARLVHKESRTGTIILNFLKEYAAKMNVQCIQGNVFHLMKEQDRVQGALATNSNGEVYEVIAGSIVIATGGNGGIYPISTYSKNLTGDGYALALAAGAELIDMEFQQFEPCCYVWPKKLQGKLAVSTMLLEGGELKNADGDPVIEGGYRVQKSVLAEQIMKQIQNGKGTPHGGVWYDITSLSPKIVKEDHELFYQMALQGGVDLTKEAAEVAPVVHTCIGGIRIDCDCQSSVPGLFAAGEAAGGIHGANRIGGCAGTETLVFGAIAGKSAAAYALENRERSTGWYEKQDFVKDEQLINQIINEATECMGKALGYLKDAETLQMAYHDILEMRKKLSKKGKWIEHPMNRIVGNRLLIAEAQLLSAIYRKESRGVFKRSDYPEASEEYQGVSFTISIGNDINAPLCIKEKRF